MVFKLNASAVEPLMLRFTRYTTGWKVWNLKGAQIVRPLKQVTRTIYRWQISHADSIYLSFPLVPPCCNTF